MVTTGDAGGVRATGMMGPCLSEKVSGKLSSNPSPPGHTDGGVLLKPPLQLEMEHGLLKCDVSRRVDEAGLWVIDMI